MVECSTSDVTRRPLLDECSTSVDTDEGLGEDEGEGGALVVFGLF